MCPITGFIDFLESVPCGFFVFSRNGVIDKVSDTGARMLGTAKKETVKRVFQEFLTHDSIEVFRAHLNEVFSGGNRCSCELKLLGQGGEERRVLLESMVKKDRTGVTGQCKSVMADIQVWRNAEGKLRLLGDGIEQSPQGVVITGEDGAIHHVNIAYERMSGYTIDEVIGRPYLFFRQNLPMTVTDKEIVEETSPGHVWTGRISRKNKNGRTYEVEAAVSAIRDDRDAVTGYVVVEYDITNLAKVEKHIRQTQRQETIGFLAGGIAHDFNNIMTGILGLAELMLDDIPIGNPLRKNMELILRGAFRGKDLVRRLLAFVRSTEEEKSLVPVGSVVENAVALMRASSPATIDIRQNIQIESDLVFGERTQLHQVLLNLCMNAVEAMGEEGGVVEVRLTDADLGGKDRLVHPYLKDGPYLKVTVDASSSNLYRGETKSHTFPFSSAKKFLGEGTEIGLPMANEIVKNHQGMIKVKSRSGHLLWFDVLLPKAESQAGQVGGGAVSEKRRAKDLVLFVDDEQLVAETGKQMILRLGYDVVATTSSLEALELFRNSSESFSLVITDYMMPHMNGASLAKEILSIRPDIAIVLCSGFNSPVPKEAIKEIGITEVITKPFGKNDMNLLMNRLLERNKR